mgnify:CR=1 FL=1
MKRNLDQVMTDLDGKEFVDKATLKMVCFGAVSNPIQGDAEMPLEKKMKQYALLQKINAGGECDLSAEEISLIKERGSKLFPILIFGRMTDLLESEPGLKVVKGEPA